MSTIFDSARIVKPTAFALGISPTRRESRQPYTSADLDWAAQNLNADATGYDVVGPADSVIEHAAGCALAEARLSAGFPLF